MDYKKEWNKSDLAKAKKEIKHMFSTRRFAFNKIEDTEKAYKAEYDVIADILELRQCTFSNGYTAIIAFNNNYCYLDTDKEYILNYFIMNNSCDFFSVWYDSEGKELIIPV